MRGACLAQTNLYILSHTLSVSAPDDIVNVFGVVDGTTLQIGGNNFWVEVEPRCSAESSMQSSCPVVPIVWCLGTRIAAITV